MKAQDIELNMKTLTFDVMLHDRYVCTMKYRYCPLFPIDAKKLEDYVTSRRPSLKGKPFRIEF